MSRHPAKRFACDRCRDQKLRCPRIERVQDTEPCTRCFRAGAICVTSSPRPLGRPRIEATSTSRGRSALTGGSVRSSRACESTIAPSRETSWSARTPTWPGLDGYPDLFGASDVPIANNSDNGLPWMQNDAETLFGLQMPHDDVLLDTVSGVQESRKTAELSRPMPNGTQQDVVRVGRSMDLDGVFDDLNDTDQALSDLSSQLPVTTDVQIRLSRLSENTARALSKIDSYNWEAPQVYTECSEKFHGPEGNPLEQALQIISEFTNILEGLVSSPSTSRNTSPGHVLSVSSHGISVPGVQERLPSTQTSPSMPGIMAPATETLSTPIILLLLSVHLQIIQLYDTIFCGAYELIRDIPGDVIEVIEMPSDVTFAGVSSMTGPLFIRLIIQVVDHNLEKVERLMGFPPEFRVSGRIGSSKGIFSNKDLSGLLHATMTRSAGCGERSGKARVKSLREHMKKVQGLVES